MFLPLHLAVDFLNFSVVAQLINDEDRRLVNETTEEEKTALRQAAAKEDFEIVQLLSDSNYNYYPENEAVGTLGLVAISEYNSSGSG